MGLLKVIEWQNGKKDQIVYKFPIGKDYVNKGSKITVRDGQVVIFADKGRMADVFLPGYYTLDTNNIPILTKLMSWKYGFESPFKSDIYFVNTTQFINQKWGTANPIMIRDRDYGAVRVRGYGTYSFRVKDAYVFMQQISGTGASYETSSIVDYLKSIIITSISDALGESKIPILDVAGNLLELSSLVTKNLAEDFTEIGIELVKFNFENFSLPPELEKILDEVAGLNMKRGVMDVYTTVAQADALKEAAKNPGTGGTMGAGLGIGLGAAMGQSMGQGMRNNTAPQQTTCKKCGKPMAVGTKFCPFCGAPSGAVCPKCGSAVPEGSKFCPECGASMVNVCPKCKAELAPGAKFCPECGTKV